MRLTEMGVKPTAKKINKVLESRFAFKIDYDNMTLKKAYTLARGLTESLDKIKHTHGVHIAEKNPKYMELLMVREGLHSWMVENKQRFLAESEMGKSQAILAAKDMVDSIQDMLEEVSKMQNEQMPALLDTIRDQIGMEQADQFKNNVGTLLASMVDQLGTARETADQAARALAGEQVAQPMDVGGGMGGGDMGMEPDMAAGGEMGMSDMDTDGFGATDAEAGGTQAMGRERR
ncbi:hypothetical protein UFOVP257_143 [uncultured Caudovirales phage]|uniref:Uncharacterized protein n=1 Tax=uncultured Caudovirales phage TaxID=2100421 RepID=A0A6J5LNR5_9CAUD|nr:hypothetical protein UFOVP257_143 [uncultured Caudovirales phage]